MFKKNLKEKFFKRKIKFANRTRKIFNFDVGSIGQRCYLKINSNSVVFTSYNKALETPRTRGISTAHAFSLKKECGAQCAERKKDCSDGRPKIKLDDFDKATLLRLALNFYTEASPEFQQSHQYWWKKIQLERFTSYCALKELGFICKRRNKKNASLSASKCCR